MQHKKIVYSLIAICLMAALYFSYNTFNRPLTLKEIKDLPLSIFSTNTKSDFSEGNDWYEAKISYPKNNQKVRDQIFQKLSEFKTENEISKIKNLQEAKEVLGLSDGMKFFFNANFIIATSTGHITYVYNISTFTGGAHGSDNVFPITFNERQEIVNVEEILPVAKIEKVAKLAVIDLAKQKRSRMLSLGMSEKEIKTLQKNDNFLTEGTKPTRDNFSNVWRKGDNLVIYFGQYQVASYAEGVFEVEIPLASI